MRREIPLERRIVFALDVDGEQEARAWVRRLEGRVRLFKVGLPLLVRAGPGIVGWIRERGLEVMLDLKLLDVPWTVAQTLRGLEGLGVGMVTVHAQRSALRAALEAAPPGVAVLAVTVLTSLGEGDLREEGWEGTIEDLVVRRARMALEVGCQGVVCSGREVARLRRELGWGFLAVVPGVRPPDSPADDQLRRVRLGEAFRAGADHVVVGRPLREAPDPLAALARMRAEAAAALAQREEREGAGGGPPGPPRA